MELASSLGHRISNLRNELVSTPNDVDYAYRDTGGGTGGAAPRVLLQHFHGNLRGSP
jgi:hypothetical protein